MAHHYTLSFQDFQDAQRLHRDHVASARWQTRVVYGGFPLVAAILLMMGTWLQTHGHTGTAIGWYSVGGWFAFMSVVFWVQRPFALRRLFRKSLPDGQKVADVEFSFGEEGFRSAVAGRSEGRFFWLALVDYAENETLALMYIKKKLFLYIPKRAMPAEEWASLRQYVREKTGKL